MNKEFIPYEQALELKELGFDEKCLGYYNIDPSLKHIPFNPFPPFEHEWCLPAPIYQQAFRWFREKYGLVGLTNIGTQKFSYYIFDEKTDSREVTSPMNGSYEEAELACLNKLIELVKNK